jgi:uncharacterized protein YdhG (YjbR/CyaY superfamily)
MKLSPLITTHIATFPPTTQKKLRALRALIHKTAPDSVEAISYGIPTFKLGKRNLVHFAGYKTHIGFYPGPAVLLYFKKELARYKTSRGAVQFPLDAPLPLPLIRRIVRFRLSEEKARG